MSRVVMLTVQLIVPSKSSAWSIKMLVTMATNEVFVNMVTDSRDCIVECRNERRDGYVMRAYCPMYWSLRRLYYRVNCFKASFLNSRVWEYRFGELRKIVAFLPRPLKIKARDERTRREGLVNSLTRRLGETKAQKYWSGVFTLWSRTRKDHSSRGNGSSSSY